jgi:histidinol-phosphatase (PHP family)
MIRAAEAAGLDEYGVSDHFVLTPDGQPIDWSMPLDRLEEYVAGVQAAAAQASITVRLGIEVDFFPETVAEVVARLSPYPFDYLIGSVHYVDRFPIDACADDWQMLSAAEVTEKHRLYWVRLAELARSGAFDFVGHLDLAKKFGSRPSVPVTAEIAAALQAVAGAGLAVELNTAGWDKPCAEAYPSLELLRRCREAGIPVLMNDDSHAPRTIGAHFERGARLLQQAGYQEVVRFANRERTAHPLAVSGGTAR